MGLDIKLLIIGLLLGVSAASYIGYYIYQLNREPTLFEKYNITDRKQIERLLDNHSIPKKDKEELQKALDLLDKN